VGAVTVVLHVEASGDPTIFFRRFPMLKAASTLTIASAVAIMMSFSTVQADGMKKDAMMKKDSMAGEMKKDAMMKKDSMGSDMKKEHAMDDKMKKDDMMEKKDSMMEKKDDMMMKKDKMMGDKK
jgi:hypothetical protein